MVYVFVKNNVMRKNDKTQVKNDGDDDDYQPLKLMLIIKEIL